MITRCVTLFALAVLSGTALVAQAQDGGSCSPPIIYHPLDYFPAAGAPDVPINAPIRIRYDVGAAVYFADPPSTLISLLDVDRAVEVTGTASWLGDTLVFAPSTALRTAGHYRGTVVTAATMVGTDTFSFTTSSMTDVASPVIDPITTVASTAASVTCDEPDGGYRVTVTFDQSHDFDSARGDLEYLLYVTRAAETTAPTLEARERNFPSPTITMSFVLPRARATARVCVVVMVVDDVGHTAQTPEVCVDPIQGNYFEPLCTVSAVGGGSGRDGSGGALAGAAVLSLLGVRRRRRFVA